MSKKRIVYALSVFALMSALVACGPGSLPTPTPPPTDTAAPTVTPNPTEPATSTPEPPDGTVTFHEDFEGGLEGWQKGSDVPEDPDRPGQPVFWSIEISPDQAASGASSARFTLDGKQDDGTIWLMRSFDVAAEGLLSVHLAFDLWSASESFNTLAKVAAYAGPQPPAAEEDFDTGQAANLLEGWRTYEYDLQVLSDAGQVWVALGISAVWETEMTYYVDDVQIDVTTAEGGEAPQGSITAEGVQVTDDQIVVRGSSTLPEGTCVSAELWADGSLQTWWPSDACAPVQGGKWELTVALGPEQALQPNVQYMVRAYQPGGPNVVSTFAFDLSAPPTPPTQPPDVDLSLLLPESAVPLHRVSADLDGDGESEEIVLTGWGGGSNQLGYDFLQLFVVALENDEYAIAWQSEQLPTDLGEALRVRDLNDDGLPEVLSVQAMGASGETLYVLSWQGDAYGWLTPQGGRFAGDTSFGENGASVRDVDGDGLIEILASYGPAARSTDVYRWDGQTYVYQETWDGSEAAYERVSVADAGLSLEVPSDWVEVEPGMWTAPENDELRLAVASEDLAPYQEPEAVLLPQPSVVLDSEHVELSWGRGRWFTVEVYGEAVDGEGQAPVEAVETHVLVVLDRDGGHRAIDVYASAPTAEGLADLAATLQRAMTSVELQP